MYAREEMVVFIISIGFEWAMRLGDGSLQVFGAPGQIQVSSSSEVECSRGLNGDGAA